MDMRVNAATRLLLLCALFVATTAVVAGCGGGDSDSTASSTASTSTPASASVGQGEGGASKCGLGTGKPATGKPIPVGAISEESGGPSVAQGSAAAGAYFDCVNANGGIHGQPIKFIKADSAYNPQKA